MKLATNATYLFAAGTASSLAEHSCSLGAKLMNDHRWTVKHDVSIVRIDILHQAAKSILHGLHTEQHREDAAASVASKHAAGGARDHHLTSLQVAFQEPKHRSVNYLQQPTWVSHS